MRGACPPVNLLGPFGPILIPSISPNRNQSNILKAMDGKQLSPWNGIISGTTAAILANTLVYPLDVVKTRLQVQIQKRELKGDGRDTIEHADYYNALDTTLHILREDGICGLYSGLNSSIFGTASMNFAYFYWSAVARSLLQSIPRLHELSEANKIVKELGLGVVGGAMAQLCTNPIAVISTRQQTRKAGEKGISMWTTMMEIVQREDGWTGLWRGLKVNLILVVNPMITYGVYQSLRGRLVSLKKGLSSLDAFLLGAISKVLATIATHPLIVAKTMLQSKPPDCRNGKPFKGFTEALAYVISNEGFFRLYKGLAPQIIKGFLVQGLMMMLKERYSLDKFLFSREKLTLRIGLRFYLLWQFPCTGDGCNVYLGRGHQVFNIIGTIPCA
ncbi:unnamed protein product [Penicillium nalgiovense]|uniref:Mitochondrial thiamine pyrophosphate carrier 1 n=1 Tax=Penicillium nalgiovense TaxID=60175 RepID=A0A9W4HC19_PENNA|nr:unnamed protein product [Penicillium nalgiovense]CAG7950000.1 unnamed protein product [Penicillium nalgiovense]CAG7978470.1 unnamed protein product [Penicillium nalgiovense]CAG8003889.1 unnamed protein product [Penicillium nalgiovense]CAG8013246.1 unnamed protein product [Penicillium nalgiovense]